MRTGIDSWSNPGDIGPIYPFAGTEVPLVIIGVALWIAFHVLQTMGENREWNEAEEAFDPLLLLPGADEPAHVATTTGTVTTGPVTAGPVTRPPDLTPPTPPVR